MLDTQESPSEPRTPSVVRLPPARTRADSWQAALPVGICTSLLVASVVAVIEHGDVQPYVDYGWWTARALALGLCLGAAATVVLWSGGRRGLGTVLTVSAVSMCVYGLGGVLYFIAKNGGWHLPPELLALLRGMAIFGMHGSLAVLPLWFPQGRLERLSWRWVVVAMVVVYSLYLAPIPYYGWNVTDPAWKAGVLAREQAWWGDIGHAIIWMPRLLSIVVLVDLIRRLKTSTGLRHRQLSVCALGYTAYWTMQITDKLYDIGAERDFVQWLLYLFNAAVVLSLALISVAAVLRDDLTTFDRFLRRTLIVLGLAIGLSSAFYGLYLAFSSLLNLGEVESAATSAALSVLALRPAAGLLWRAGDLLLYGRRAKPYEMLRALAESLSHRIPADEVPVALCGTVVRRLGLPAAQLTAHTRTRDQVLARAGEEDPDAAVVHLDLLDRGERVGMLSVQLRPGQRTLDANDRAALDVVTDQLGPVVSAIGLREELRISRERVVSAREEERRRLRRDLHDDLGPTLAGMRLQLDAAASVLEPASGTRSLVEAASGEAARSLDEVRRIIDDLRPPVLDDCGLAAALTALAARFDTTSLTVVTSVPETLPELPAATETAAYRIAAEALANTARHSGADTAQLVLRVAEEDERLVLEITDSGHGLPANPRREGVGLTSMSERAEEIGGRCEIGGLQGSARGTVVRALLPLQLD
ncbi:sensor histidine kinase [Streptomyces sp. NPDC001668]|uniref:sensor histidine kinase n=1 Tax=unclassified Streptomyces TaxID=2593676 RepID=UPI0036909FB2